MAAADEVRLPSRIAADALAHLRLALPNEGCGLIVGDAPVAAGGRPLRFVPLRNTLASPVRYEADPTELVALVLALEETGETIWAIVHSHVRTEARPSATDIAEAYHPDALQLIAGPLADAGTPTLRAWRIVAGAVEELSLSVR